MDHGVSVGPIDGIIDMAETIDEVASGGANAVIVHKGIVGSGHRGYGRDIGLIIHLSASTALGPDPDNKVLVTSVEKALQMGADAVSVHVNVGSKKEPEMLNILGTTAEICDDWGMPLIAMMYPRGEKIKDEHHADVVKLASRPGRVRGRHHQNQLHRRPRDFPGSYRWVSSSLGDSRRPRVETDRELLEMVKDSVDVGGAGVAIGRNIFQAKSPRKTTRAIAEIVHNDMEVDDALKILNG